MWGRVWSLTCVQLSPSLFWQGAALQFRTLSTRHFREGAVEWANYSNLYWNQSQNCLNRIIRQASWTKPSNAASRRFDCSPHA